MRIVRFETADGPRVGLVDGADVVPANGTVFDLVPSGDPPVPLSDVALLTPMPRPGKVICVGLNYRDHAIEANLPIPSTPILFAKFPSSVIGNGDAIRLPTISPSVDYEAELAIVIGRGGSAIDRDHAWDHVLGYTCLNDISARDIQMGDGQWVRGKSLDTFCPIGPWIATRDEVPDPHDLRINCLVNGEVVQDSRTSQMIFGVPELIAFISAGITLEPGDVIATGTPPGVGYARKPPRFLAAGDVVEVEIDGLGTLMNPVV